MATTCYRNGLDRIVKQAHFVIVRQSWELQWLLGRFVSCGWCRRCDTCGTRVHVWADEACRKHLENDVLICSTIGSPRDGRPNSLVGLDDVEVVAQPARCLRVTLSANADANAGVCVLCRRRAAAAESRQVVREREKASRCFSYCKDSLKGDHGRGKSACACGKMWCLMMFYVD
jgi:hypothetical protein